jgi:hypothetical protein
VLTAAIRLRGEAAFAERGKSFLLGWEFTEAIERAWCRVDLTHGFQQQILQRGVKLLADEQPVSQCKQVNVRMGNVTT